MKARSTAQAAPDGRSSRWDSHRQTRRDALIADSRKIIHRLGPDASMDDIAQAAGTSKSVFYRYFGDKAGLQAAVGDLVIADIQSTLSAALTSADGAREGISAMVAAYLAMAEASPNVYAFVTSGNAGRSVGIDEFPGFFSAVATMLVDALPDSFRRGPDASGYAKAWAFSAIGMVRFSGEWWMARSDPGSPGRADMAERIAAWLWSGLDEELRRSQ